MDTELVDSGAQPQRTALSWLRTAASITFAALLLFRYQVEAGFHAQAFLLGGLTLLLVPLLLLTGASRSLEASQNWDKVSPVQTWKMMILSISVSSVGLVITAGLVSIAS